MAELDSTLAAGSEYIELHRCNERLDARESATRPHMVVAHTGYAALYAGRERPLAPAQFALRSGFEDPYRFETQKSSNMLDDLDK